MGKVLSDDKRNPHRYDPCAGNLTKWQKRGWRTRAEAEREPCTPMRKSELEIERLTLELERVQSVLDSEDEHPAELHERVGSWIARANRAEDRLDELGELKKLQDEGWGND